MKKYLSSQKGFTLIELAAVIGITGILVILVASIFVQIIQTNIRATLANDIRENGQFVMETLVREIRGASQVMGPAGETTGKVLTLKVTSGGVTDTFALSCTNNVPVILKNGSQLNTTKIQVTANCDGSIDTTKSYFDLVAPTAGAPAAVRLNLVFETTGNLLQREFIGKQVLTQLVTLRTYTR